MENVLPICIVLGVIVSCFSRNYFKQKKRWKSTVSILIKDYTFDEYVYVNLLSLLYAVGQGGLLGASLGSIIHFIGSIRIASRQDCYGNRGLLAECQNQANFEFLLYAIACIFAVLVLRVLIETIIVIFKKNSSSSKWFALQTALTLQSNPELENGIDLSAKK